MNRINAYLYSDTHWVVVGTFSTLCFLSIYKYLIKNSTLSLKAPSLPALTFGSLYSQI